MLSLRHACQQLTRLPRPPDETLKRHALGGTSQVMLTARIALKSLALCLPCGFLLSLRETDHLHTHLVFICARAKDHLHTHFRHHLRTHTHNPFICAHRGIICTHSHSYLVWASARKLVGGVVGVCEFVSGLAGRIQTTRLALFSMAPTSLSAGSL